MIDHINELSRRYRALPLLIDTNLLLLLFLGRIDNKRVELFKRTSRYTVEDYALLEQFIEPFNGLIVTPNILTELSNLSGQLNEPLKSRYFRYLAQEIQKFVEIYSPSNLVSQSDIFVSLGLTDASIHLIAEQEKHLVLTDDLPLYVHLSSSGIDAINFNHLREYKLGY